MEIIVMKKVYTHRSLEPEDIAYHAMQGHGGRDQDWSGGPLSRERKEQGMAQSLSQGFSGKKWARHSRYI